jgi:ATP-binding cassette subfamily F protein 3
MLAKMQPIAAMAEDPSLSFAFPSPTELKPPLITLEMAAVGYVEANPVLRSLNLRIDPDDRIALLGRNGNELVPLEGAINASGKMRVGYFTQYQVEELHGDDTPLQHMNRAMEGQTPGAVRAQLGRFGFSGDKATTAASKLSGGERARLALALITRDAPHLLILDEPTNHLDVDAREALVQALNDYDGAVILISHDRHIVELTADRLVLVENGVAVDYPGSIDDYIDFVLGRNQPKTEAKPKAVTSDRRASANARNKASALKRAASDAEAESARLAAQCSAIDRAMFDPAGADPSLASLPVSELSRRRASLGSELAAAEARWLEASERLESLAA